MANETLMPAEEAVSIMRMLEDAGIRTWLEGGWGVDALVSRQTRDHGDLDLFIELGEVDAVRTLLSAEGFAEVLGGRPANFVMRDGALEVDLHVLERDADGNGLYPMSDGTTWICPAEGLSGRGTILGHEVRCFTPELQLQCYSGYDLDANDLHDIALLRETFQHATALPLEIRACG
jgi:lincosamide nucleotidyltransferase A/C/D/E